MYIFPIKFVIFALLCTCIIIKPTSSANNKEKKDKLAMKKRAHSKPNPGACSLVNFERDFVKPHEIKRTLIALNSRSNAASKQSLNSLFTIYDNKCKDESKEFSEMERSTFNLTWRYQFVESAHCIRVELDLGNVTRFLKLLSFTHYMFSYRELTKENNYLQRQPIVDSKNKLIIHRVKIRPYIVCVTFYKQFEAIYATSGNKSTTAENELSEVNIIKC